MANTKSAAKAARKAKTRTLHNKYYAKTMRNAVWTGRPGVLRFTGLQRVGHDWATELNWIELKITVDGDCSHEIKRPLRLGKKVITNLDSILKSKGITLPTKVRLVKATVFPVVTYECESWTIKKATLAKELMLLNCGIGEDSWESLGLQGDQTSPS